MTYEAYCEWFLKTYGRSFAATHEQFEAALRQPCHDTGEAQQLQRDYEFDYETDKREGW